MSWAVKRDVMGRSLRINAVQAFNPFYLWSVRNVQVGSPTFPFRIYNILLCTEIGALDGSRAYASVYRPG